MKRIIRLTESDLVKIVHRVINEGIKISKDERIKLIDNKNFLLVIPLTNDASCKYGATTKWCVSTKNSSTSFNSYKDRCNTIGMVMIKDPKIQQIIGSTKIALNSWGRYVEIHNDINRGLQPSELDVLSNEYGFVDDLMEVVKSFVDYHHSVCENIENEIYGSFLLKSFPSLYGDNQPEEEEVDINSKFQDKSI
tara:strand:+ start:1102 stop:1683 length:582 start_codon:yes stop_codon:yes gene_type:complete